MAATARRLRARLASARGALPGGRPGADGAAEEIREHLRGVAAHPTGSLVASANILALAGLVNGGATSAAAARAAAVEIATQLRLLREAGPGAQRARLRVLRGLQAVLRLGSEEFGSAAVAYPLLMHEVQAAAAVPEPAPPTVTQRGGAEGSLEDTPAKLGEVGRAIKRWTDFAGSESSTQLRSWLATRADAYWEEALEARTAEVASLAIEAVCESKLYWLATREEAVKKLQRAVRRYLARRRAGPQSHRLRGVPSKFELSEPGAPSDLDFVRHLFPAAA